ncbi:MAG: C4-type zinc ribbon domain-containing protein [Desulfobulbales bacterium]|nr:C4-type zinc ribbon domain-containing protein [Desulfobulbales bacterium]
MNEVIKQLTELQIIDLEIAKLDAEINAEQAEFSEREEVFNERQASVEELKEKIEAADTQRRELEAELSDEMNRIKERQAKMMQVQTNREYQSLLKEIEDGKKSVKEKEEEIVRIMETSEANTKIMAEEESLIGEETKALASTRKKVKKHAKEIEDQKTKILVKREKMAKDIKNPALKKYDMLRIRRNGKAVVGVVNGVCQGCFMSIPPQHLNDILKGDRILNCPTCQRILFYQPESDKE